MREICRTRKHLDVLAAFRSIEEPDCHIAQISRPSDAALREEAKLYLEEGPALVLIRGTADSIQEELKRIIPSGCDNLLADMLDLVRMFQHATTVRDVRFRLERVCGDSCRRFHVDSVTLRLLCTYAGPGVQWKFAAEDTIHETEAGIVILLKGVRHPRWSEAGAVLHRSPPLSTLAVPVERLVLTLDHPDACGMTAQHGTLVER